jgi:hypothetical protein
VVWRNGRRRRFANTVTNFYLAAIILPYPMRNTPFLLVLLLSSVLYSCHKDGSTDPDDINNPNSPTNPASPNTPNTPNTVDSSEKKIKAVVFRSADNSVLAYDVFGVVGSDTVKCLFAPNTAINNLIPDISFLGKSISPVNKTARDFTNPVAYTVTALDGTTKKYIVSCSVADSATMLLGKWSVIKDSSTNDNFVTTSGVYVFGGVYTGVSGDYWEFLPNGILNFHANNQTANGLKYSLMPNARLYVDIISSAFDDGYIVELTLNKATFYWAKTSITGGKYYRKVYLKK